MKEQSSQAGSDMKSAIASQSPAVSEASQHIDSDLSAVSLQSGKADDWWQMMDDQLDEMTAEEEKKKQRMAAKGKAEMHTYVGNTRKLADKFLAAKTRGTEDYSGTTGDKQLEKRIAEGQRLDVLRVLPPGLKVYPPYIDELSDDKAAIERHRQHLGLPAASSSATAWSSSNQVISEKRKYLENLTFTKLKEQAKSAGIRVPSKMRATDKSKLVEEHIRK